MLENKFYKIIDRKDEEGGVIFNVELLRDCEVYQGHFPGEPVAPGVCNIQMMKECVEKVVNKHLMMHNLQQARLTTLVTPLEHQFCEIKVIVTNQDENILKTRVTLGKGATIYLDLKAEMKCII